MADALYRDLDPAPDETVDPTVDQAAVDASKCTCGCACLPGQDSAAMSTASTTATELERGG